MAVTRTINGIEVHFDYENLAGIYEITQRTQNGIEAIYGLVWGGIKGYCVRNGKDTPITFPDVVDYVDQQIINGDKFEDLDQALADSKKWQSMVAKGGEAEKKSQSNQ